MRLTLKPRVESGKDVLTVSNVSKAFDRLNTLFDRPVLSDPEGANGSPIIGKNGTGKTTLLKMIDGLEPM
jgi:ATP-binding cassette subfamily F protein 3